MMRPVVNFLQRRRLLLGNTATCCSQFFLGDVIAQRINEEGPWDWRRTMRMACVGLVFGPMVHGWYRFLDGYVVFRGSQAAISFKKVVCDTATTPVFSCTIISGVALQEGKSVRAALDEYRSKYWNVFKLDMCVWPPSQFINFFLLPPQYRVVYVNVVGLIYNTCMSYIKHDHDTHKLTQE